MQMSPQSIDSLRQLRIELQEDAGKSYPNGVLRELLVLYDVCRCLELNIFLAKQIMGEVGWSYVVEYINQPCHTMLKRFA